MSPISRYGVILEFPTEDREAIWQELVAKSGGVCQLCEDPIDVNSDDIIIEHKDNKGKAEISNLYIAHRSCNSLKRDLPYSEAKLMIKFKKFCESKGYNISFDDILDKYVGARSGKTVKIILDDNSNKTILVFSGENRIEANVMIDPATQTKYFFAEVPIEYIHNDREVQPRRIDWNHTWAMALDFQKHPVHEPSSCRVQLDNNQIGKLLQFDGQHKTTAQILLGRKSVPTKIYINPDVVMVKDLIITIQNRIKKMSLAPSIYLEKMDSVQLEKFRASGADSERAFVEIYLLRDRPNAKKGVFSSIYKNILSNSNNRFAGYIQPEGIRGGKYPLSMNLTLNRILKILVCQDLQTVQIGSPQDFRVNECENVVFILNILADELLEEGKWPLNTQSQESSTDYMKAKRFFRSGAVRYWNDILRSAIINRLTLLERVEQSRLLLRPLTDHQRDLIQDVVVRLANHPIWTDNDGTIDGKLNENNAQTSETLFAAGSPKGYGIKLNVAYLLGII
jgi:hypothetical protein